MRRRSDSRRALSAALFAVGGLVVAYALFGFLAAPQLIERWVAGYARDELGGEAVIGGVRVNPFLLRVEVTDFRLDVPPGRPIGGFERLAADLEAASLLKRTWTFAELAVDRLGFNLEVARDGTLDLGPLAERLRARADVDPSARHRWLVRRLVLRAASVALRDLSGPAPVTTVLAPIDLEVLDLATVADRPGTYTATARLPDGAALAWNGDITLAPPASSGSVAISGLKLATAWAFLGRADRPPPAGIADLAAHYRLVREHGASSLVLDNVRARVTGLALARPGAKQPALALHGIVARGGRVDLQQRSIRLPLVEIAGGQLAVTVAPDGGVDLAEALAGALPAARTAGEADRAPWRLDIDTIRLERIRMAFRDLRYDSPLAYDLELTAGSVQGVANHGDAPLRFDAAFEVAQGGTLNAAGTAARDLGRVAARIRAADLSLVPLRPLVAQHAALVLESGRLSLSAEANWRAGESPRLDATGALRIDELLVNEEASGDRFLAWQRLAADQVAFGLAPARLAIAEVELDGPEAKIAIARDGTVNLARVVRPQPAPDAPAAATPGSGFVAEVSRVRVRNATVDFSDQSLALPFATRVRRINGTAVGLSSDRASRAELRLAGRIEDSGSARVEGGLNAFDPRDFTDLRVEFDNVAMPPLTPYAATFAGRRIAAGRLWLDLRYRVENGRLDADNRIVMQDFELGERVETARALDLPLELAVAVLKDSRGRISIAVPVTGDVGNAKFSYGAVFREALAGLVTRVATAPFRALARLAGGGGETIGSIHFEPGRARLLPPERDKLDQVAATLAAKPELRLVVHGPYDAALDGAALRERHVRRELARALGTGPGEGPGPIAYGDAATQRALESLLGDAKADALARSFARETGREPERVNRFTALFGKASPDRAFYQAVFRELVSTRELAAGEVERLAAQRSEAIVEYLAGRAGVASDRLETAAPRGGAGSAGESVTAELALRVGERVS